MLFCFLWKKSLWVIRKSVFCLSAPQIRRSQTHSNFRFVLSSTCNKLKRPAPFFPGHIGDEHIIWRRFSCKKRSVVAFSLLTIKIKLSEIWYRKMVGAFFVKCTKWPFFLYWAWPWHRQDTGNISSSPTTTDRAKQRKSWFKPHSALKWNLQARIVVSSCQLNKAQKQKSLPILNCWSNLYWPTNLSSKSTPPYTWWYWWK